MRSTTTAAMLLAALAAMPGAARAQDAAQAASANALPPELQKLLDAALAGGDPAEIATVAKYLKQVAPLAAADIDLAVTKQKSQLSELHEEKVREAGAFDLWKGEGQVGGFVSTGNSETVGISVGFNATREGLQWRHKLRAQLDYQRSNGVTSRNQITAAYEPNFKFDGNLFAYGLAQFDRDRFQGFDARYSLSGGLGYRAVGSDAVTLDLKAGPAWRRTNYIDQPDENQLSALAGAHLKWQVTKGLTFAQTADSVLAAGDKTVVALTSLDSKLNGKLSARFSYQLNYESDPPEGLRAVDTLSRITLVYGF